MMSSEQQAPESAEAVPKVIPPLKKRAPTLYAIIIFKLIKGLLCIGLAIFIYHEADKDMGADYRKFMESPAVTKVFGTLKLHPESKFFTGLRDSVDKVTETAAHRAAWGAVLLSLFPLVEGIGLLFRVSWAGWLAIGESAFFIPIEFYKMAELARADRFSWSIAVVTVANIVVVSYLYIYRDVLFRHHVSAAG